MPLILICTYKFFRLQIAHAHNFVVFEKFTYLHKIALKITALSTLIYWRNLKYVGESSRSKGKKLHSKNNENILSYKKYGREFHEAKQKKQSGC